jgi:cytidylate kinase
MPSRVLAIDGPAGSGKSTTAAAVAERLSLPHVESGALYRAVTLAALDAAVEFAGQRLVALASALPIRLDLTEAGFRPTVAGVDVTQEIRSARVTASVSEVSAVPEVRDWVNGEVRDAVSRHPRGAVLDGRDIGTVVFPDAVLKVFLVADPAVRARRRLLQDGREPDPDSVAREVEDLKRRDEYDSTRTVAPLKQASDAVALDTSNLSFEEQVEAIVERARNLFP